MDWDDRSRSAKAKERLEQDTPESSGNVQDAEDVAMDGTHRESPRRDSITHLNALHGILDLDDMSLQSDTDGGRNNDSAGPNGLGDDTPWRGGGDGGRSGGAKGQSREAGQRYSDHDGPASWFSTPTPATFPGTDPNEASEGGDVVDDEDNGDHDDEEEDSDSSTPRASPARSGPWTLGSIPRTPPLCADDGDEDEEDEDDMSPAYSPTAVSRSDPSHPANLTPDQLRARLVRAEQLYAMTFNHLQKLQFDKDHLLWAVQHLQTQNAHLQTQNAHLRSGQSELERAYDTLEIQTRGLQERLKLAEAAQTARTRKRRVPVPRAMLVDPALSMAPPRFLGAPASTSTAPLRPSPLSQSFIPEPGSEASTSSSSPSPTRSTTPESLAGVVGLGMNILGDQPPNAQNGGPFLRVAGSSETPHPSISRHRRARSIGSAQQAQLSGAIPVDAEQRRSRSPSPQPRKDMPKITITEASPQFDTSTDSVPGGTHPFLSGWRPPSESNMTQAPGVGAGTLYLAPGMTFGSTRSIPDPDEWQETQQDRKGKKRARGERPAEDQQGGDQHY